MCSSVVQVGRRHVAARVLLGLAVLSQLSEEAFLLHAGVQGALFQEHLHGGISLTSTPETSPIGCTDAPVRHVHNHAALLRGLQQSGEGPMRLSTVKQNFGAVDCEYQPESMYLPCKCEGLPSWDPYRLIVSACTGYWAILEAVLLLAHRKRARTAGGVGPGHG